MISVCGVTTGACVIINDYEIHYSAFWVLNEEWEWICMDTRCHYSYQLDDSTL